MNKTYIKIILREIKGSFGRFAAIFGIVTLGVGVLSGLVITTPNMQLSVNKYYDYNDMADIYIKGDMGFSDDDFDILSNNNHIEKIMPAYVMDTLMNTEDNETIAARVYGLGLLSNNRDDNWVNKLDVLEGRMPERDNECLVERSGHFLKDYPIGSKISISEENDDFEDISDIYNVREYEVVGIVSNPFYFAKEREMTNIGNGTIGTIMYVDESSFALDVYTDFYITIKGMKDLDTFSDEYELRIENIVEDLEELGEARSLVRYNEVVAEANEELADGKREYEEGKLEIEEELADALKELEDGQVELNDGLKELLDGEKELADARITLRDEVADAQTKIQDGKKELADGLIGLEDGEKELADAEKKLKDGEMEYKDGYTEYLDSIAKLEDAQKEFDDGEKEYLEAVQEIEDGKRELSNGERQLSSARNELNAGEEAYSAGQASLEAGRNQLEEGMMPFIVGMGYSTIDEFFNAAEEDSELKNSLDLAIASQIQGLEANKTNLESAIGGMEFSLSKIEEDITFLQEQLEEDPDNPELIAQIEGLRAEKKYLEVEIAVLKDNLSQIDAGLTQLQMIDSDIFFASWTQIKNGELELENARKTLDSGWSQYYAGRDEIRDARRLINDGEEELVKAKEELEEGRIELENGWKELEEGRIELENGRKELDDGWKDFYDGREELDDGWKEYYEGLEEITDAEKNLEEETSKANNDIKQAEIDLAEGWQDYQEGKIELLDGEKEYLDAVIEVDQELADALAEIEDAEKEIADLEVPEWYVLDRGTNVSFVSFELNSQKVADIAIVFPIFFYLIAALVAASTMTRMVDEERIQIGTLKALGYTKEVIIFKYIVYCGLASVLGSIVGLIFGFKIFPSVIYNAYDSLFHLPEFHDPFNWKIAIVSAGLSIFSVILVTILVCYKSLKEKPSTLMLPRAPKPGKRILLENVNFIWSRMSFKNKSTIRNIFRYKRNFFMTVIGVAGCTALLLTGFGLRDSISIVTEKQYGEIFRFDVQIDIDEKSSNTDILKFLDDEDNVNDYLHAYMKLGVSSVNNEEVDVNIVVVEDIDKFPGFVGLQERDTGNSIEYDRTSVVITDKISETLDIGIGDTFVLENSDTDSKSELLVTGIAENYLSNYVFIGDNLYKNSFAYDMENNMIAVDLQDIDPNQQDEFIEEVLHHNEVINAQLNSRAKSTFDNLLVNIDYIVMLIILLSGALAFIVLYNLNNININERNKELATFKVLGFHNEEVGIYVFRESIILAVVGIIVGLFLGTWLLDFIIITVEDPDFMLGRSIHIRSYLLAALLTMVFSIIVNIIMYKKIKNIEMVESMKAND